MRTKENYAQTNPLFIEAIRKYGCLFLSIYFFADTVYTIEELNGIWRQCVKKGYIVDDSIENHDGVCKELGLKAHYTQQHVDAEQEIPEDVFAIGCFVHAGTHFVCLSRGKTVIYDPTPNSNSVRFGYLKSMRFYKMEV